MKFGTLFFFFNTSLGSSPRCGLCSPYRLTNRNSARLFHHFLIYMGRPAFDPSCTEFVYSGCWQNGELLHVLPLIHSYSLSIIVGPFLHD